jgi:hypothetical protein
MDWRGGKVREEGRVADNQGGLLLGCGIDLLRVEGWSNWGES